MVECGDGSGFLNGAVAGGTEVGLIGRKDLEGDQPIQPRVARLIDDAHAAFAEFFEDIVIGKHWPSWLHEGHFAAGRK